MEKKICDLELFKNVSGEFILRNKKTGEELGCIGKVYVGTNWHGSWCYTRFCDNKTNWKAGQSILGAASKLAKTLGYS